MSMIDYHYYNGDDQIVYIDIDSIDATLARYLDQVIVDICYYDSGFSVDSAKQYIREYINRRDIRRKQGAVAEFFIHVYLKRCGLEQGSLFRNLEENSPKKGFDGVYVEHRNADDEIWIVESKSGKSGGINPHEKKVKTAYKDLKKKIEGRHILGQNNPWLNAYTHARLVSPGSDLENSFRELSENYRRGARYTLNDYNIIPSGTIFDTTGATYNHVDISRNIFTYFNGKNYNKLFAICVTQRALSDFETYLGV